MSGAQRPRRALYSAIGVGVGAGVLIAVLATRSVAPGTAAATSLAGKVAPSIQGTSIVTDQKVSLASFRGRYVLVDFFGELVRSVYGGGTTTRVVSFSHRTQSDVTLLGVDIDDSASDAAAFLQRTGASWPAVEDASGTIAEHYGVADPPEMFLITPGGRVVTRHIGQVSAATLDEMLAAARRSSP